MASDRLREIRGHADRQPRVASNRYDPSNRRITIMLPFESSPTLFEFALPPAITD
jgi:hypothetical protein